MPLLMRLSLLLAGLIVLPAGCGVADSQAGSGQVLNTPRTPGWTGRTTVVGSHSTVAGDAVATELQQKWPYSINR